MTLASFTSVDWSIVVIFLIGTTWFGHAMRGSGRDLDSFFAGGRNLPWWAVAGSLIATSTSALTFVAVPAAVYREGGNLTFFQITLGFVLGNILLAHTLLKHIHHEKYLSPYDFIEDRLGTRSANLTRILFSVGAVLSQGVRLLTTALVLSVVTQRELVESILIITGFSVVWTWMGGITTVIWTDLLLLLLFAAGSLLILGNLIFADPGGWSGILAMADTKAKLVLLDLSLNPTKTYTLWVGLFGTTVFEFAQKSIDQVVTQRLYCCRSLRDAQKALYGASLGNLTVWIMLAVGLGLVSFFSHTPPPLADSALISAQPDRILPYYIVNHLPVGVSGLLVAALFAAGISTLDSALSALSQTTTTNLIQRYLRPGRSNSYYLRASRGCVVIWGALLGLLAILFNSLQNEGLLNLGLAVPGYLYGAILGITLLALFRIGRFSAIVVGALLSLATVIGLQQLSVSFFWWYPAGAAVLLSTVWIDHRFFDGNGAATAREVRP